MMTKKNRNTCTQIKHAKISNTITKTIYSRNNATHTAIPKPFFQLKSIIVL